MRYLDQRMRTPFFGFIVEYAGITTGIAFSKRLRCGLLVCLSCLAFIPFGFLLDSTVYFVVPLVLYDSSPPKYRLTGMGVFLMF